MEMCRKMDIIIINDKKPKFEPDIKRNEDHI
jgi:hypothetical protein